MSDVTPWAGILNLMVCPLLLVFACWRRHRWLATACLCALSLTLVAPLILPFSGISGFGTVLWRTWFEDWTWLMAFFPGWLMLWKLGMLVLMLLGIWSGVQTLRQREPLAGLAFMPIFGIILLAIKFWNLLS